MPLEAKKMAPVTLNECPVNLNAPERVCNGRFSPCARHKIVCTMAFLVATVSGDLAPGNKGEELVDGAREEIRRICD